MPDPKDGVAEPVKTEVTPETADQPPQKAEKPTSPEEVPPEVWEKHTNRFKKEAKEEIARDFAKSLGITIPEEKGADPIESLKKTIADTGTEVKELKNLVKLREWESRNPFVLNESNEEKWREALKNQRYAGLEYEEIAKLSGVTKEKGKDEPPMGSVPSFNRVIPRGTKEAVEAYRKGNKDIWKFE